MALQLSMNINHEILRLALAAQGLNSAEIEDLMPLDAADRAAAPAGDRPALSSEAHGSARSGGRTPPILIDGLIGTGASNNWVVSGARTISGKPLLANDPHLRLGAPAVWYLAHLALERPGADAANVAGASLPGVPLIVLGRGDHVAWGFTNTGADVQDIFIEKVNPDNPREYLTPDGWRQFQVEEMAIAVKGADVRKVERRRTRHGPVLPGFYRNLEGLLGANHVAALKWTALRDDDTTIAAGLFDPNLKSVADYMARMRLFGVPMQSMVVADTSGKIGMIAPGLVPVRDPSNKVAGRAPVPGWDATYDWKGYLKFDELPRVEDANVGAIGTANARMVDPDYPHHLTFDWERAFRQQRIKELIFDRDKHDVASMRAAQVDVLSPAAAKLQPMMIAAAQAGGSVDNAVLDQLTTWDATMRADRPEPLIFTAWMREAVKAIYGDDLGPAFDRYFDYRAVALIRLLEGRAKARDWCDDRTTPERESCGEVLAAALNRALRDLEARYGDDRRSGAGASAPGLQRASPVRRVGFPRLALQCRGCEPRRQLHAQSRQGGVRRGAAVRQQACRQLPGDLRFRRPRPLALHPDNGPVGQSPVAVLPFFCQALGEGRVHRDRHQTRDHRQSGAGHVDAHAASPAPCPYDKGARHNFGHRGAHSRREERPSLQEDCMRMLAGCAGLGLAAWLMSAAAPAQGETCKDVITAKARSAAQLSDASRERRARENAIANWKRRVRDTHGLRYSFWYKAQEREIRCGGGASAKHCTVSAKPCRVL